MGKTEPKIILLDIETLPDLKKVLEYFPQLSNYPGLTMKATVSSIACVGYQVYGENKINCIHSWDYGEWTKNVNDDSRLVKDFYDAIIDADCVVTHNGKRFDWKFIQTRLAYHGLRLLPKIKHVDTREEYKRNFLLFNNKLDTIAKEFLESEKMENGGWKLWVDVHGRNKSAMKLMSDYCKKDVELLNGAFKKVRPLITSIPNYNLFTDARKNVCPNCGSTRIEKMGFAYTKTTIRQRWRCKDCWTTSTTDSRDRLPRSI